MKICLTSCFQGRALFFFAFIYLTFSSFQINAQCHTSPFEGVHVVQENENLFRIAMKYNVSVDNLCMWNSINPNDALSACQELVVSTALVNPPPANQGTSVKPTAMTPAKKQSGKWHTVRPGEDMAKLAYLYGYTEGRFREFNKIPAWKKIKPGAVLRSSECTCDAVAAAAAAKPAEVNTQTAVAASGGTSSPTAVSDSRGYMTLTESAMIDEINLMRSNPKAYVKYVKEYAADYKESWGMSLSSRAVNGLIRDLEKLPKLSTLRPHPCLYQMAKEHGDYLKRTGRFQHTDAKGVGPWSRTMDTCPQVKLSTTKGRSGGLVGNENLVAGHDNVRQSVIDLLIDEGISSRGHREALLAPEWRYVACYNFGTVNQMQNHWVQNFGR